MQQMDTLDRVKLAAHIKDGTLADHPYLPVLLAVCTDACDMVSVFQADKGEAPAAFSPPARTDRKGLVLTVGDDLDESRGTAAFDTKSLSDVLAKANLIVLQVAMFQRPVMTQVAGVAALGLTAVVIETSELHELEWLKFVDANSNCPVIIVTPRPEQ
jgi:hypothetical protein